MTVLGLKESCGPEPLETAVSLGALAEMTGFPVEYIKRELFLDDGSDLTVEELRERVMAYLCSNF